MDRGGPGGGGPGRSICRQCWCPSWSWCRPSFRRKGRQDESGVLGRHRLARGRPGGLGFFGGGLWPLAFWLTLFFVAFNILEATLLPPWCRAPPTRRPECGPRVYNTTQAIGLFSAARGGRLPAQHFGDNAVLPCAAAALAWLAVAASMFRGAGRRRRLTPEGRLHPWPQSIKSFSSAIWVPTGNPLCCQRRSDLQHPPLATTESWKDKPPVKARIDQMAPRRLLPQTGGNRRAVPEKGSQVYLEGRIKTRKWRDKEGRDRYTTEIRRPKCRQMLGSRQGMGAPAADSEPTDYAPAPRRISKPSFDDLGDDIITSGAPGPRAPAFWSARLPPLKALSVALIPASPAGWFVFAASAKTASERPLARSGGPPGQNSYSS